MQFSDIGIVSVVDDLGVVFIPMFTECKPDIVYRSNAIESTLAMAGPIAIFVEKDTVYGVDVRHGKVKIKVPIFNMSPKEMVWNISVSGRFLAISSTSTKNLIQFYFLIVGPILSLCTFFEMSESSTSTKNECETGHPRIMSLVSENSGQMRWVTTEMTGVAAVSSDGEDGKIAVVTALGDLVVVDSLCRVEANRLTEGESVIPFMSQQTRDGIVAWGVDGIGQRCIRMLKPGGAVFKVLV